MSVRRLMRRIGVGAASCRRHLVIIAAIAATGAVAVTPAGAQRTEFSFLLTTATPGAPSGLRVHVAFNTPGDPGGKPSPLRSAVFRGPEGLRFDTGAIPQCTASDAELALLGSMACPRESRLDVGFFQAITGFGPPLDPFAGDMHGFNGPAQLIQVLTVPGMFVSPAVDRLTVEGSTLTAHPPDAPGGPPDGRTSVKSFDYDFGPRVVAGRSYLTAPPTCATGLWTVTATFGFADGTSDTVTSQSPCDVPKAAAKNKRKSKKQRRKQRRARQRDPRSRAGR